MTIRKTRILGAGALCGIAATVAVWSGPLLSATSAMHSVTPKAASTTPATATAPSTVSSVSSGK